MRDLQADLQICNKATPGPWETEYGAGYCVINEDVIVCSDIWQNDAEFIAEAREGWPHAIERAIKAEAENAKLRAVVDAARKVCQECPVNIRCIPNDCWVWDVKQALAELDKEESIER